MRAVADRLAATNYAELLTDTSLSKVRAVAWKDERVCAVGT